jgi:hypothetical protein
MMLTCFSEKRFQVMDATGEADEIFLSLSDSPRMIVIFSLNLPAVVKYF